MIGFCSDARERLANLRPRRLERIVPTALALILAAGWAWREVAFARTHAELLRSATVTLSQVPMSDFLDQGKATGKIGLYINGDTPASTKFVTGRFVLDPGKAPHPAHQHPEEEVLIVESGTGTIVCDGQTTEVGPGSVMFTTPNAMHGITNTGSSPMVYYFIKWQPQPKN